MNDDRQDVWARVLADPSIYAQLFLANHDDLDYHSMPDPLLARIAVDVEPFFASSALAERAVRSSPELPSVCGRLLAESHDGFLLASALDHVPAATARGHIAAWLADPEPCHLGRATLFAAILAALLGPDGTLPADDPLSDRLRACLAAEPTEFLDQVRSRLEREHGLDLPRLELRR